MPKSQTVTKLWNSNGDKTQKFQNVAKLKKKWKTKKMEWWKKSNGDKTQFTKKNIKTSILGRTTWHLDNR